MQNSHLYKRLQEFIKSASKPLIVVLGSTASGKTTFSIELALELGNAEIINADSRQLYKYLDIGTAKITTEEMCGIPHHLLDVLDPNEEVTASWFKEHAGKAINDIHQRGKIPIMVGGSMLYISAVIDGLEFPEGPDPELRKKLNAEYDQDAGESLYTKLTEIDPETAFAFSRNNKPYVVRAMEIWETTKQKPSIERKVTSSPYDLLIIGIQRDRDELSRRIDLRTKELFEKGWVEEVRGLMNRGYTADAPAMKSHGYREIIESICHAELAKHAGDGQSSTAVCRPSQAQDDTLRKLQDKISVKARQYAKRQMTWWRGDSRIEWIHLS